MLFRDGSHKEIQKGSIMKQDMELWTIW